MSVSAMQLSISILLSFMYAMRNALHPKRKGLLVKHGSSRTQMKAKKTTYFVHMLHLAFSTAALIVKVEISSVAAVNSSVIHSLVLVL